MERNVLCCPGLYFDLLKRLSEGRGVFDSEFDRIYAPDLRNVSSFFWTPVSVAVRAAELLVAGPNTRVLDVGSGAGKFCLVGAASTGASFTGVEHRERFVRAAGKSARQLGLDSVSFIHGTFESVDISSYDAVYLFNPFEENIWYPHDHVDRSVELSEDRYMADVLKAERFLRAARVGTRVVTYHGFGGVVPDCYRLALRERRHSGLLELWVKTDASPPLPQVRGELTSANAAE